MTMAIEIRHLKSVHDQGAGVYVTVSLYLHHPTRETFQNYSYADTLTTPTPEIYEV